jgi:hypothetical protein
VIAGGIGSGPLAYSAIGQYVGLAQRMESVGSPLTAALVWRGAARWWQGRPGWREDLDDAAAMARTGSPTTRAAVVTWKYAALQYGVLRVDDATVRLIEDTTESATGASNVAIAIVKYTLGAALLNRDALADRQRRLEIMAQARDVCAREPAPFLVPVADVWDARKRVRSGDRDHVIAVMRAAERNCTKQDGSSTASGPPAF